VKSRIASVALIHSIAGPEQELKVIAKAVQGNCGSAILPLVMLVIFAAAVLCPRVNAQSNEWTWMAGSQQPNQPGMYGTLLSPAGTNTPGSRNGAAGWRDASGNLWLFGGFGYDSTGQIGELDDLWEFAPSTQTWTWVAGANTANQAGVYGTLQTKGTGNAPGSRMYAVSWADSKGNLWLFGGQGFDSSRNYRNLNDLWEFDVSTDQWTWMGGSATIPSCTAKAPQYCGQPGIYGTLGSPSSTNSPGGRFSAVGWADASGNLWLFGGTGTDAASNIGNLNDLWELQPSTGQWKWASGADTVNQSGVYGTLQSPAAGNIPGARTQSTSWIDNQGNLWLFGGSGLDSNSATGYLNDLWEFAPSSSQWTWIGGSATVPSGTGGQTGVYGTWMTPASGNVPGGRYGAVGWTDASGNLWLFGGIGLNATPYTGRLDDLWEFSLSTHQWAWVAGSAFALDQPGAFGSQGVSSLANTPSGRDSATAWTDPSGKLWLFGGSDRAASGNQNELNDLWEFQTPPTGSSPAEAPVISPSSGPLAAQATVSISDSTPGATIYFVENGIMPPTQYSGPFSLSTAQTVDVIAVAVAGGYAISPPSSAQYTIPVAATPTFSLAAGTYTTQQSLSITDATPGATIFFTTDGSTATTSSTQYTEPITISNSETIQAIAVANGYAISAPAGAVYTIWPISAVNEWAWMNGPNSPSNPVWGTLGVPAIGNLPARRYRAAQWTDAQGNLWMFGGFGYGNSVGQLYVYRNDLWEFSPVTDEWAWMGGSNDSQVPNEGGMPGVYGNLGTASAANIPGGRQGASSWTDSNGNFWLFGGGGFDSAGTYGELNDLWMFQPKTNEWTWVTGGNVVNNCFQANTYTFCAGESGVYGTQNVAAPGNTPGAREGAATWYDKSGNLWLFGGIGMDPVTEVNYYFNDLWKFSLSTKQWTWVSGNSTTSPQVACQFDPNSSLIYDCGYPGTYGTLGTPSPMNIPGGRRGASTWIDGNGNLWLFGGEGFDSVGSINPMNDLWEFTPSNAQWTWKGGANAVAPCVANWSDTCSAFILSGTYGTQGTPAVGNIPGYTSEAAAWTDKAGNFWLFSGADATYSPGGWPASFYWGWNNLWVYSPTANEWTWMTGTQPTKSSPSSSGPSYGEQGVPDASNTPPTTTGAAAWTDQNGNFWLFGGAGGNDYDSVTWELKPLAPTPAPSFAITTSSNQLNVTEGASASSTVGLVMGGGFNSAVALTASGQPSGVTVSFSPSSITGTQSSQMTIAASSAAAIGTYTIAITGTSGTIEETATISLAVTAYQPPPTLTVSGTAVTVSPGATTGNTSTITLTPAGGFTGNVALTASVTSSPTGAQFPPTLSFGSTSPVNITGTTAGTATLTINTTAAASSSMAYPMRPGVPWSATGGAALACLLLFGMPARRRSWRTMLGMLMLLASLTASVVACGGGGNGGGGVGGGGIAGTTAGTYTVTVTGTSGSITSTGTVTLTVR